MDKIIDINCFLLIMSSLERQKGEISFDGINWFIINNINIKKNNDIYIIKYYLNNGLEKEIIIDKNTIKLTIYIDHLSLSVFKGYELYYYLNIRKIDWSDI